MLLSVRLLVTAFTISILSSCTGGQNENLEAKLTGDGSVVLAVNFGSLPETGSADKTLTFANSSSEPMNNLKLTMSDPRLTFKGGSYPGEGGSCGASLAPATSCTVVVRYVASVSTLAIRRAANNNVSIDIRIEFEQGGNQKFNIVSAQVTLLFNNPPVAKDKRITLIEDTATSIALEASDPDGNRIEFSLVSQPTNGQISGTLPNITYTPNSNFTGVDTFTFKVNDGKVDSNIAVVNLTYSAENDAPVAEQGSLQVLEDIATSGTLVGSDIDGDAIAFSIVGNGSKGDVVITNAVTGAYTYFPKANANGTDTFTFKVTDGIAESAITTIAVSITPVDDAPVASNLTLAVTEDVGKTGTLVGSDVEGAPLTFSIVTQGAKGSATIVNAGAGTFTYQPRANANGPDSFTFRVSANGKFSNTATVSVDISAVNDAPSASNGSLSVVEDSPATGLFSASDVDGNPLTFSMVSNGSKGTAVLNNPATGAFTYTPNPDVNGPDTITFRVSDGVVQSNVATISVNIASVNDVPVATDFALSVTEDVAKAGTLLGSDADGETLSFQITSSASKGTVAITNGATGAFTYTPRANENGTDTFKFRVLAGSQSSNTATVSVSIAAVNDTPVVTNQNISTLEDTAKTGKLVGSDIDGDSLTFSIVANGSKGTAVITNAAAGEFTYTPNANANGNDTFRFIASDGDRESTAGTIIVGITAVDDDPVATSFSLAVTEDIAKSGTLLGSDVDGAVTFSIVSNGTKGIASITNYSTGAFTYTPNAETNGADSFTFKVQSGSVASNVATVSVEISAVNDAPVVAEQEVNITPNTAGSLTLSATDVDSSTLSFSLVSAPKRGNAQLNGATVTYTPNADSFGVDSFKFKANDGALDSNVETVWLRVPAIACVNPTDADFGGGAGTSEDPYLICTPRQFYNISSASSSQFVLGNDIDIHSGPNWSGRLPISWFTGKLDGRNFRISNTDPSNSTLNGGLFAQTNSATISDLHLRKIRSGSLGGTLIASAIGTNISGIRVDGCGLAEGSTQGAGLIGTAERTTIANSIVRCRVIGRPAGGFVGSAYSVTIRDSVFKGSVRSGATEYSTAGGLVGEGGHLVISDSQVQVEGSISAGSSTEYANAGGFVGCLGCNRPGSLDVKNSFVAGDNIYATGTSYINAGGLVGDSSGSPIILINSYVASNISASNGWAGTLIGRAGIYANSGQILGSGLFTTGTGSGNRGLIGNVDGYRPGSVNLSGFAFPSCGTERDDGVTCTAAADKTAFYNRNQAPLNAWDFLGETVNGTREIWMFPSSPGLPVLNPLRTVSTDSGGWRQFPFASSPFRGSCSGNRYVKYNAQLQMWVGAVLCENDRYKILLANSEAGPYQEIGDEAGWGQDHCQLVNPSFTLPNEDNINSGNCSTCALGGSPFALPASLPFFYRNYLGRPFQLAYSSETAAYTPEWYKCGVSIP